MRKRIYTYRKQKIQSGFSLTEILVAFAIVSVISSIVIVGQTRFSNSVILSNTTYEVALAIRQAQAYGTGVKYFGGTDTYDQGYGIRFSNNAVSDKSRTFVLFADRPTVVNPGDVVERYDGSDDALCNNECVKVFTIRGDVQISRFCGTTVSTGTEECFQYAPTVGGPLAYLDIMFFRPQLSACLRTNVNPGTAGTTRCSSNLRYSKVTIHFRSERGLERRVAVYASGQIDVE